MINCAAMSKGLGFAALKFMYHKDSPGVSSTVLGLHILLVSMLINTSSSFFPQMVALLMCRQTNMTGLSPQLGKSKMGLFIPVNFWSVFYV